MRTQPTLFALTLALLAACGSSTPPSEPASTGPSPQALASRTIVDSGLLTGLDEDDAEPPVAVAELEPEPFEVEEPELVTSWTVRRGESLAHYARWAELPVETIAEASGIDLTASLHVGDTIVVPGDGTLRSKVESARDRHHARRVDGYLATRGGAVTTQFHTVRTGETGWSVATRELGIPVWLLESYNPAADLGSLRPGEQLLYPVLADTVAQLDEMPSDTVESTIAIEAGLSEDR